MNTTILSGKRVLKSFYSRQFIILTLLLICVWCVAYVYAEDTEPPVSETIGTGPDIAIIDISAKMDISDMGNVPLGTIPDERLLVTITVQNIGSREAPGYKLRTYLVRADRLDEIGSQLGGDLTDVRLGAGETRTYTKNWALPGFLRKAEYRLMVVADTSTYFTESDTSNNRMVSSEPIVPGTLTGPEGAIPVYSPADITSPGNYVLKRDIDGGKKVSIFQIKSSGVIFDGGGHTITGNPTGFTTGIYVDAGTVIRDVVIKNVVIENVDAGIWLYKSNNGKITGSTFRNVKNIGLRLDSSHDNEIAGNTFDSNNMGIGVFQSRGNIIYNNLFLSQHNAVVNDDFKNQWNVEPRTGTNILGGELTGGNAWFDPTGAGFSKTAQSFARSGISDSPYSLNPNNIDYYPLTSSQTTTIPPPVEPVVTPSPEILTQTEPVPLDFAPEDPVQELPVLEYEFLEPEPEPTKEPVTDDLPAEEFDESDSSDLSDTVIAVSPYADIGVKEIHGPDMGCPGAEFNFTIILENSGGYDADLFLVRYYLTEDQRIDSGDIFLGEKMAGPLRSLDVLELSETYTFPDLIGLRNYYIGAVANPGSDVYEDKKDNNTGFTASRMRIRAC